MSLGSNTIQNREAVEAAIAAATNEDALPYLSYVATLTQAGTASPVATLMENTIGGTPAWSYVGVGTYRLTITGQFTNNKTYVTVKPMDGVYAVADAYRVDVNVIEVKTYNVVLTDVANDIFYTPAPFEVRVYA